MRSFDNHSERTKDWEFFSGLRSNHPLVHGLVGKNIQVKSKYQCNNLKRFLGGGSDDPPEDVGIRRQAARSGPKLCPFPTPDPLRTSVLSSVERD